MKITARLRVVRTECIGDTGFVDMQITDGSNSIGTLRLNNVKRADQAALTLGATIEITTHQEDQ